jgi:hypothetical protein
VDDATEDLAQAVIGALIEVPHPAQTGMPERCYKLALSHELTLQRNSHMNVK